jgi:hypothetical protein
MSAGELRTRLNTNRDLPDSDHSRHDTCIGKPCPSTGKNRIRVALIRETKLESSPSMMQAREPVINNAAFLRLSRQKKGLHYDYRFTLGLLIKPS